ncbi:MAG: hypothetical protein F6J87_01370 [Spirulina sp. SIO3F2]|nr:hypothetical protein [Spirulina sp. SIO3F2]
MGLALDLVVHKTKHYLRSYQSSVKLAGLRAFSFLFGEKISAALAASTLELIKSYPDAPTVLCLSRPLFSKDIIELTQRTHINYICINLHLLGHIQSAWLPKQLCQQTLYQKHQTPEYQKYWCRAERFAAFLLKKISSFLVSNGLSGRIDAILTGHIDYWQGECVRLAAQHQKIPFLVLCREHATLPIQQTRLRDYYREFKFQGDGVAVFGESTKNIFCASGACEQQNVWITGAPRWDCWKQPLSSPCKKSLITLLSYHNPAYGAPHSFAEVLEIFSSLARSMADQDSVQFLVKAKGVEDQREIQRMLNVTSRNLRVAHQMSLKDIFTHSRLVIGFNSIALIEALFTEARVVLPYWSDACKTDDELTFAPSRDPGVAFAQSPEQLVAYINTFSNTDEVMSEQEHQARQLTLNRLIHFPSGCSSSEKVEQFLNHYIISR